MILPSIAAVDSIEMVRDGGSLAVVFLNSDGRQACLFFQFLHKMAEPNLMERTGYASPFLLDRMTGIETSVSWKQARLFLHQIRRLTTGKDDLKWLSVIEKVSATEGQLPSEVERFGKIYRLGSPFQPCPPASQ